MPRTARLEPLPPIRMERPPGRTLATRGRSRSHRGGTAEVEDRRIGVTVRWCCRLTHRLTSENLLPRPANAAPRATGDTIDCREAVLRTTIAARYTPAFCWSAAAGRRAGGGKTRRSADSCRRPWSSAKAARGPRTVSSGTGRRERRLTRVHMCILKCAKYAQTMRHAVVPPDWVVALCRSICAIFARI